MSREHRAKRDPDLIEEYDFSKGTRGKYAKRYAQGTNLNPRADVRPEGAQQAYSGRHLQKEEPPTDDLRPKGADQDSPGQRPGKGQPPSDSPP